MINSSYKNKDSPQKQLNFQSGQEYKLSRDLNEKFSNK